MTTMHETATAPVAGIIAPASVLVTGASSGIGMAMVRRLVDHPQVARVFAVSRTATANASLEQLRVELGGERLQCIDADITDERDLERLAARVGDCTNTLHLVVNAAGVLHDAGTQPEKSVGQVTKAALERVFGLNAFAPILLAKALLPLLAHGEPAVFASLSARVGSIGDNRSGGWYAYRASKAAQNQLMTTFSIEMARRNRRACCLMLHPGTVDTPLSAPFQARVTPDRLFSTERAATQLLAIIARATPADSGRFIAWDGRDVPW